MYSGARDYTRELETVCFFSLFSRLSLSSRQGLETDREAELLAYQISREVVSGRHPVASVKYGLKMAATMAQVSL